MCRNNAIRAKNGHLFFRSDNDLMLGIYYQFPITNGNSFLLLFADATILWNIAFIAP